MSWLQAALLQLAAMLLPASRRSGQMEQWRADLRDAPQLGMSRSWVVLGALTTAAGTVHGLRVATGVVVTTVIGGAAIARLLAADAELSGGPAVQHLTETSRSAFSEIERDYARRVAEFVSDHPAPVLESIPDSAKPDVLIDYWDEVPWEAVYGQWGYQLVAIEFETVTRGDVNWASWNATVIESRERRAEAVHPDENGGALVPTTAAPAIEIAPRRN